MLPSESSLRNPYKSVLTRQSVSTDSGGGKVGTNNAAKKKKKKR